MLSFMIAKLQCVVLDCADVGELSAFYQALLGGVVNRPDPRWSLGDGWAPPCSTTAPARAAGASSPIRPATRSASSRSSRVRRQRLGSRNEVLRMTTAIPAQPNAETVIAVM